MRPDHLAVICGVVRRCLEPLRSQRPSLQTIAGDLENGICLSSTLMAGKHGGVTTAPHHIHHTNCPTQSNAEHGATSCQEGDSTASLSPHTTKPHGIAWRPSVLRSEINPKRRLANFSKRFINRAKEVEKAACKKSVLALTKIYSRSR